MDFVSILVVALLIGVLVGMTGMGGGALMTPALIFLGVSPTAAVANDLVVAACSKTVGAATHLRHGSPNLKLVGWLVLGSVPSALAGGFLVHSVGSSTQQETFLRMAIGVALLFAAATYTLRVFATSYKTASEARTDITEAPIRPLPTILVGVVGGLLVGITSVGAGSIIMVALLLLYPHMRAVGLVGTDLAQAVPLVIAAAIGHVVTTGVDWGILIPLLLGSMPGTILGAHLAGKVQQKVVRRLIVIILLITGLTLLHVPTGVTLAVGLMALIFGPAILNYPIDAQKRKMTNNHEASADF